MITIEKSFKKEFAKLAGGVAVIKVGAATEVEMKEKKRGSKMHFTQQGQRSKRE